MGPKPRLVPLINGADRNLRRFVEDVWGQFDTDHARPGAPLFPSERKWRDGPCARATADVFRRSLADAAERRLPGWAGKLTPHVLRHYCASQLSRWAWRVRGYPVCGAGPGEPVRRVGRLHAVLAILV